MSTKKFNQLAYSNVNDFVFGVAPSPVVLKNGLSIGGGQILPELNFTLPPMLITQETFAEVLKQYTDIIEDACKRAHELYVPGFVAEIELLPPATYNPAWGVEITKVFRNVMWEYESKHGLKSAVRITP
ncbi:MAG: methanol--corrinoid methyltransferase, partial [Vallitaleaceae bacterium]|nr:methanol--corrinoid methyltransferase [Vallitaleaceae bacterium]